MRHDQDLGGRSTPVPKQVGEDRMFIEELQKRGAHAQEQLAYHQGQARMWERILLGAASALDKLEVVTDDYDEAEAPSPSRFG
jgi:hypothetical protein